jgi:hypothetical protein
MHCHIRENIWTKICKQRKTSIYSYGLVSITHQSITKHNFVVRYLLIVALLAFKPSFAASCLDGHLGIQQMPTHVLEVSRP